MVKSTAPYNTHMANKLQKQSVFCDDTKPTHKSEYIYIYMPSAV